MRCTLGRESGSPASPLPGRSSLAFPFPLVRASVCADGSSAAAAASAPPRRGPSVLQLPEDAALHRFRPVPSLAASRRSGQGGQEGLGQLGAQGERRRTGSSSGSSAGKRRRTAGTGAAEVPPATCALAALDRADAEIARLAATMPGDGPDWGSSSGSSRASSGSTTAVWRAVARLEQRQLELQRLACQSHAALEALGERRTTGERRLRCILELCSLGLAAAFLPRPFWRGFSLGTAIFSFLFDDATCEGSGKSAAHTLRQEPRPPPPPRHVGNGEITDTEQASQSRAGAAEPEDGSRAGAAFGDVLLPPADAAGTRVGREARRAGGSGPHAAPEPNPPSTG